MQSLRVWGPGLLLRSLKALGEDQDSPGWPWR